jgi:hypothetical protein
MRKSRKPIKRIGQKKKQGKDTERKLVDKLLAEISKLELNIASLVDTDSKLRVFDSNFDFQLFKRKLSIVVEAKRTVYKTKEVKASPYAGDIWGLLTDTQKVSCDRLNAVGTPYYVCHFRKFTDETMVDVYKIVQHRVAPKQYDREIGLDLKHCTIKGAALYFARLLDA